MSAVTLPSLLSHSQEAAALLDLRSLPMMLDTDDIPKRKLDKYYKAPTAELIAYLDFSVSTTGVLSGVKVRGNWMRF